MGEEGGREGVETVRTTMIRGTAGEQGDTSAHPHARAHSTMHADAPSEGLVAAGGKPGADLGRAADRWIPVVFRFNDDGVTGLPDGN